MGFFETFMWSKGPPPPLPWRISAWEKVAFSAKSSFFGTLWLFRTNPSLFSKNFLFPVGENVVSESYAYPLGVFFGTEKVIKILKQFPLLIKELWNLVHFTLIPYRNTFLEESCCKRQTKTPEARFELELLTGSRCKKATGLLEIDSILNWW